MNKEDKNPRVSVVMASCNNGRYIEEAIQSVKGQDYDDWELIVLDDASEDNSKELILKELVDRRVQFIANKDNRGYIAALRRMIAAARGEIIFVLDSDDVLTKDALGSIAKAYDDYPDCGFIYAQFVYCDKNLNYTEPGICRAVPEGKTNLHGLYAVAPRTFKKSLYDSIDGLDEEMLYAEDRDLIYQMEEITKFYFLDKVIYNYRRLPGSQTMAPGKREVSRLSAAKAVLKAWRRRRLNGYPNISKQEMADLLLKALPACIKAGNIICFFKFLFISVYLKPINLPGWKAFFARGFKFIKKR